MDVQGIFDRHETKHAIIRNKKGTSYPIIKTVDQCIYSAGSGSNRMVSETLKADVSGVVLFNPDDIITGDIVATSGRIDITGDDNGGYINNALGYAIGVRTINVDGFNEIVRPVLIYDQFKIDGDTTEYEVRAVNRTAGATSSISFEPALAKAVVDDTFITLTPVYKRLSVIIENDIALQNEVILVPVKEFV